MNNSAKTAMKRKSPSAPMKRLASDNRLVGRMLDYGCGYGFDADEYGMDRYDYNHYPYSVEGPYDTITCNYVLNVIEEESTRLAVLACIQDHLHERGRAYITVRDDRAALTGHKKSTGTWQGHILLELPVVYKGSGYVTYELRKFDSVGYAPARLYPRDQ